MANPIRIIGPDGREPDIRHLFTGSALQSGGGGGNSNDMEKRLAKLEEDAAEIKSVLGRLAPRIDEMYGRMQHMPTLWQIVLAVLAINAGIVGVSALGIQLLGSTAP